MHTIHIHLDDFQIIAVENTPWLFCPTQIARGKHCVSERLAAPEARKQTEMTYVDYFEYGKIRKLIFL